MAYDFNKDLILTCITPKQTESFKKHEEWFRWCVNRFTETSNKSTVNKKKVEILSVEDKEIRIRLYSETSLGKAPGRALSMLSRLLITKDEECPEKYDSFFKDNLFHKKLFSITQVSNRNIEEDMIEDSDVVKALVDYIVTPKSSIPESKKRAFSEIRRIAIDSKIIEITRREND